MDLTPEDTYVSQNGYVQWKIGGRWQAAHRFIVEGKLGRLLLPGERVRFIDGDKKNLDPDNLEVTSPGESKEDRATYLRNVIDVASKELEQLERQGNRDD